MNKRKALKRAMAEKRKRRRLADDSDSDNSDSERAMMLDNKHNIRVIDNTIYFNEDITHESVFRLNYTLRKLEKSILARSACLAECLT